MKRILIAEDDEVIREALKKLLRANGYAVTEELPCDLALLDINLPGESGYALCEKIKRSAAVPVIFLTARDGVGDELAGFCAGGDDYIKKPYNADILLARIARLLREDDVLCVNGMTLNEKEYTVSFGGRSARLTANERRILARLMRKKSCGKDDLLAALWEDDCFLDENALYVSINRLRAKLRSIGCEDAVKTVRGAGYTL